MHDLTPKVAFKSKAASRYNDSRNLFKPRSSRAHDTSILVVNTTLKRRLCPFVRTTLRLLIADLLLFARAGRVVPSSGGRGYHGLRDGLGGCSGDGDFLHRDNEGFGGCGGECGSGGGDFGSSGVRLGLCKNVSDVTYVVR